MCFKSLKMKLALFIVFDSVFRRRKVLVYLNLIRVFCVLVGDTPTEELLVASFLLEFL